MRFLPLLVTALTGCTFYIAGGTGDAGGTGSDSFGAPDAQIAGDAPADTINPPLADASVDSSVPIDSFIPPIDMSPPQPDAPPVNTPLETLTIPCTGQVVVSSLTYSSALIYRVRVSGLCKVDEVFGNDVFADAEYYSTNFPRNREDGVDVGVALYDTTLGFDKDPNWGSYNASHVYEVTGPGYDVPVPVRFHDKANNAYGNNSGTLTLEIFLQ